MALDNEVTSTLVYPPLSNYVDNSYLNGNNYYFSVPKLTVPKLTTPRLTTPRLTVPKLKVPIKPSQFKRERRHVKDLGDILFGNPLTGTRQLRETLEDNDLEGLVYVPILNRVAGFLVGLKEREIDPLLQGHIDTVAINALESVGDSLDTLANPVKALIPAAGGGTYDDFLKSMGWLDGEYRERYQWNTGNFLVDLAGEILTDPVNWVTFGGKAFVKESIDDVVVATKNVLRREFGDDFVQSLGERAIREMAVDTQKLILRNPDELVKLLQDTAKLNRAKLKTDVAALLNDPVKKVKVQDLLHQYNRSLNNSNIKRLTEDLRNLRYGDTYKKATAAFKFKAFGDALDKNLLFASLAMTPTGTMTYAAYKKLSPAIKSILNNARIKMKAVSAETVFNKRTEAFGETVANILDQSYYSHKKLLDGWEPIFRKYNLDYRNIQKLYNQVLKSVPFNMRTPEYVNELFVKKLSKLIPELKSIDAGEVLELGFKENTPEELFTRQNLNYYSKKELNQLLNVFYETGSIIETIAEEDKTLFKEAVKKQTIDNADTVFEDLRNIDKGLRKFGINGIKDLDVNTLKTNKHLTNNEKQALTSYFKKLGITNENKKVIANILEDIRRTRDSVKIFEAKEKIINILTEGATDTVSNPKKVYTHLKFKNYENLAKAIQKEIPDVQKPILAEMDRHIVQVQEQFDMINKNVADFLEKNDPQSIEEALSFFDANDLLSDQNVTSTAYNNFFESYNELFKEFNKKKDITKVDINTIKDFLNSTDELTVRINLYDAKIKNRQIKEVPASIESFVSDAKNYLQLTDFKKYLVNYVDIYNSTEQLYLLQLSKQGQFNMIYSETIEMLDDKFRAELCDPSSSLRTMLEDVSFKLRTSNPELANYLDNICASVDSTIKLKELVFDFSSDVLPKYETNKDVIDFASGELFNIVHAAYNDGSIIDLTSINIDSLVNDFMWNFERYNTTQTVFDKTTQRWVTMPSKIDVASADDMTLETLRTYEAYEDAIRNGVELTDSEYADYEILQEYLKTQPVKYTNQEYLDYVRTNVEYKLKQYYQYLLELADKYGMDNVRFGQYFNETVVDNMSALSDSFVDIMKALEKNGYNADTIIDMQKFILNTTGQVINAEKKEAFDYLSKYYLSSDSLIDDLSKQDKGHILKETKIKKASRVDVNTEMITEVLNEKINTDSLARRITTSFTDIAKVNNDLAKMEGVLDKRFGKQMKSYIGYKTYTAINDWIGSFGLYDNIFSWSTRNGVLAFKKEIDLDFITAHNLFPQMLKPMESAEMRMLQLNLDNAYKYVDKYVKENKEYLYKIRQSLIELFSDASVSWGPLDPASYFTRASLEDVAAWDLVARQSGFDRDANLKYIIKNNNKHIADTPQAVKDYIKVHNKLNGISTFDESTWDYYLTQTPSIDKELLFNAVTEDFSTYIKDPDSLQKHKGIISEYIKRDIGELNKLKESMSNIDKHAGKASTYKKGRIPWSTLNEFGIYKETSIKDAAVKRYLKYERENVINLSIRNYNAKELRSFVDYETRDGILIFYNASPEPPFKYTAKELEDAGLSIERVWKKGIPDDTNVWLITRTDAEPRECIHTFMQLDSAFPELQERYNKLIIDNEKYYQKGNSVLPNALFTGDVLNGETYGALLDDPALSKALEKTKQNVYSFIDDLKSNSLLEKETSIYTLSIAGDINARNIVMDLFSDTLASENITYRKVSESLDNSLISGSITAIKRNNNANKYIQLIMNDDFSIDNPLFRRMFKDASDKELQEIFKRNNFDACILREGKNGKPRLYKIYIENKKQLQQAIEAGAVVLPHEVYRNALLTINKDTCTSKLLNFYTKTIVGTYKTIYLNTFGWLFRNSLDSLVYKNMSTETGFYNALDTFKYDFRGARLYKWYNDLVGDVIIENNTYSKKVIKERIAQLPKEEQDLFKLVDTFMWSAGNGGLTESLSTFLKSYYDKGTTNEFPIATWWNENIIGEGNKIASFFNHQNELVEKSARLGLFLNLVDNGLDPTDAIRKVIDTHFDYQGANLGLLEQIFWFSTFPINNMFYYLNYGLTKNPEMFRLMMDVEQLSWNGNGYTWDDVRNSNYLKYNALVGNVRFQAFGKNIVLKTGSSVLDFFNILVNPFGEATQRLNPFLSVILGLEGVNELNALSGVGNRYKQITTGRSYIPSVYATLYDKKEYPKRLYKYENYRGGGSSWHPKPKKPYIKKPDNIKRLAYKFQTYRYYFGKGPNRHRWLTSTTSIEPFWYMKDYRWMRQQRRYYQGVRQINRIR